MVALSETEKKAFDFAQDLVKQVITLATAIITLSITFTKDFVGADASHSTKLLLEIAWLFYIGAVAFGIGTLMALTGSLEKNVTSISGWNIRTLAIIQLALFVAGLALTIAAGWQAI